MHLIVFFYISVTTMLFMFINHMTFFVACVAVHEKRIDNSRHCCTCTEIHDPDDPDVQGRSGCFRCCCTGRKPTSSEQTESIFERATRKLLTRFVLTTSVKMLTCLVLLAFVGCAIWQMLSARTGLYKEEDVKAGTHFHEFNTINKEYFKSKAYVTFCPEEIGLDDDEDDSSSSDEDDVKLPYQDIKNSNVYTTVMRKFGDKFVPNKDVWLKAYSESDMYNDTSEPAFVKGLKQFLVDNEQFANDVVFTSNRKHILMYRFLLETVAEPNSDELIDLRDDIDDDGLDITSYSPDFLVIDSIKPNLLEMFRFFGIQLGILYIVLLFYPNRIRSIVEVSVWYVFSAVGLIAFTGTLGVFINSVPVMLFMISMSYFVNVILFTYYSFSISEGETGASRVHSVLNTTTPFMFNTTFAALCGLMILFIEESYVFITIFKVLVIAVGITIVLVAFFIPTVLSMTRSGREGDPNSKRNLAMIDVAAMVENVGVDINNEEEKQRGLDKGFFNNGFENSNDKEVDMRF